MDVSWSGGLDDGWRQRFEAAFSREFGFSVSLRAAPPEGAWDVSLGPAAEAADLARAKRLASHEWNRLFGAPSQTLLFDSGALAFSQQPVQPLVSSQRAAQPSGISWDALLDPKWKGRLGVGDDASVWADLSSSWGDEQTTKFVHGLAALQPARGAASDLERQLEAGSLDVLAAAGPDVLRQARERAAAVAAADVQPLLLQSWVASPVAGGSHPSAGLLFAGFLITQEGQQLWQEYAGQSSIYSAGTPNQQLVQARPYILAGSDFLLRDQPARRARYAQLLGY